ncbi:hypothetical protein D3C72_916010 [compost metagenome]
MSLTSLNTASAANEGRVMLVLHPEDRTPLLDEKKKPVTITLLGRDSDTFIQAENASRNRAMEQLSKNVKFSAAAAEQQTCETLARCTVDWSGIPKGWIDGTDDETAAKLTEESAAALYASTGVKWLRDQVDEFVGTRANFLKRSPTI